MRKINFIIRCFNWCKRFSHRKGYGVHSPFAFNLITWVIYEKYPYYAYEYLKKTRCSLKQKKGLAKAFFNPVKVDQLIFRLVNYFQPEIMLEIGTFTGLTSLYMHAAKKAARIVTIDSVSELNIYAKKTFKDTPVLDNYKVGVSEKLVNELLEPTDKLDFVLFNIPEVDKTLYESCLTYIGKDSLLIVNGIYASREMQNWWEEIKNDNRVGITFDLYDIGLVFFDKTKIKQHYIVNF